MSAVFFRSLKMCCMSLCLHVDAGRAFHSFLRCSFHVVHTLKRWCTVCLSPDEHHQQRSSSMAFIRFRQLPVTACPVFSW
jgi:hypothetical protein